MPQGAGAATGLPSRLSASIEALSGLSTDDVRVIRNSPEPARLGALAFACGTDIHLGPGQEAHLPHEAWHTVQQKQGRVQPRNRIGHVALNGDADLEREADSVAARVSTRIPVSGETPAEGGIEPAIRPSSGAERAVVQRQTPGGAQQPPQQQAGRWSDENFVFHYYTGRGRAVDLAAVGLADTFRNHPSVQQQVQAFAAVALAQAGSGETIRDETVIDVTDTIFSVGHSAFYRTAYCGSAFCGFTFAIRDSFRDPVSLGFELGGTPYPINYQWTEARPRPTIGK